MAIVLNRKFSRRVGELLNPLQVGVGTVDGAPIAAKIAQLAFDKGCSILSVDVHNEFNSIPRAVVYAGLALYLPELLPWFITFYGEPSQLRSTEGDDLGLSSTRVRQGDPLGPLLFCVGLHSTLLKIKNVLPTDTSSNSLPAGLMAFMDDIFIWTSDQNRMLTSDFKKIIGILQEIGLKVNISKTVMLCKRSIALSSSRIQISTHRDGIRLLGVPIGTKQYRIHQVQSDINKICDSTMHLHNLQPMDAFILLQYCINSAPVYLKRSVDLQEINNVFRAFDDHINLEIFRIMKLDILHADETIKKRVQTVRSLPKKLGGLGLISHSFGAGDKNMLNARISFNSFIDNHYATMSVPDDNFSVPDLLQYADGNDKIHPFELLQRYYSAQSNAMLEELAQNSEDKWFSAWFRSNQFKGSGKWMEPLPHHLQMLRLQETEFICNLRARVGIAPITEDMLYPTSQHIGLLNLTSLRRPVLKFGCKCGIEGEDMREARVFNCLHCLDCTKNKDFVNQRHNLVRNILGDLLRKSCSGALVELEPHVVGHSERPDILLYRNGRETYLDVVIGNPSCPSQLNAHHSDQITDATNLDKERVKLYHYRNWNIPVTPFAVEATGRFGPSALKFIKSVTQQMGKSRAIYLQQIQYAIAKFNGRMFTKTIRSLRKSAFEVQHHVC
jgi:hypothetical protein